MASTTRGTLAQRQNFGDVFYWGQLMAAALLGSLPVAFIYSFFVDYYVAGLTAGSVKA